MRAPWRTDCTDCGKCCEYMLLPVFSEDHAKWASYHGAEIVRRKSGLWVKINTPCKYLNEDKTCAVYGKPERPEMCKTFFCAALKEGGVEIEGVE